MTKVLPLLTLLAVTTVAGAQGTIQISNNAGTRFRIHGAVSWHAGGPQAGVYAFGVFAGLTPDNLSTQPVLPLALNSHTAGLITAPNAQAYPIPGFEAGATVFLQIRGWEARFGTDTKSYR